MKIMTKEGFKDSQKEGIALIFRDNDHLERTIKNLQIMTQYEMNKDVGFRAYMEFPDDWTEEQKREFSAPLFEGKPYDELGYHKPVPKEKLSGDVWDGDEKREKYFTVGVIVGMITSGIIVTILYHLFKTI